MLVGALLVAVAAVAVHLSLRPPAFPAFDDKISEQAAFRS
jgi:hypothetical protein